MGKSLGRAPLGRSDTEATRGSVGKERDRSDDRVDGGETAGNSLGRARVFRTLQLSRKIVRPRLFKWFAIVGRWDMQGFVGRERH